MALGYVVTLRNNQLDQITTRAGASALFRIYDPLKDRTAGILTDHMEVVRIVAHTRAATVQKLNIGQELFAARVMDVEAAGQIFKHD